MDELYDLALADNGKQVLFTQASPIHGCGLFTNEKVPVNTILCRRLGLREALSLRDKRAIIGIDGLDPATPEDIIFKRINHSCHPNACLTDTGCLVSTECLADQAEITVDYTTLLQGSSWTTTCLCGLPNCRRLIAAA